MRRTTVGKSTSGRGEDPGSPRDKIQEKKTLRWLPVRESTPHLSSVSKV